MTDTVGFVREDGKPEGYVFGRPTKYRPEMCEQVVAWGKLGKSRAWMCSRLDISPQTMANWEATNPDFLEAMTRARMHAQAHWEDQGQDNLLTAGFQASVWSRSMSARFPDDWRETHRQEQTGPDGGPVKKEVHHTGIDEFTSRIAGLAPRVREGEGNSEPDAGAA